MVYDREEAVRRALAQDTNVPDTCQLTTRTWCQVRSAGDLDGDGAADAEDGWKSEPAGFRRYDREPLDGAPVSYLGGSRDNGHRALAVPGRSRDGLRLIRSTDAGGRGRVATVDILWPVREWGLMYAGWSLTCDGVLGESDPPKPVRVEPAHPYQGKTRVARFLDGGPAYDMRLLRAAAERRGDARHCLARLEAAVHMVPRGLPGTRVSRFHIGYAHGTLRVGLLAQAVRHGRHGAAETALNEIRAAIKDLRS